MTLQFDPQLPWIFHAFAAALLILHIAGGAVGIGAGGVAILARRGGRVHRMAGRAFVVGMLLMTGIGGAVAPFIAEEGRWTNTVAGAFSFYLVVTGWTAVRRRAGESGGLEKAGLAVALGFVLLGLALLPVGLIGGQAEGLLTIYVFCAVAGIAAVGDWRLLRRGGLRGAARIARHLWRMGLALTIAAGSFFVGQQDHLPRAVQGTFLISVPPLGALGLTLFWLARTRFARRARPAALTPASS